jgi:hypothetical protein
MKQLGLQVGIAVLAAFAVSCGAGFAISYSGGSNAVIVVRDISMMLLALFSLVGTVVFGVVYFAGAWAIGRFGGKATGGLAFVRRWTLKIEGKVDSSLDSYAIRPLAKTARGATMGVELVKALSRPGEHAMALRDQSEVALRGVSSLVRQARHKTSVARMGAWVKSE